MVIITQLFHCDSLHFTNMTENNLTQPVITNYSVKMLYICFALQFFEPNEYLARGLDYFSPLITDDCSDTETHIKINTLETIYIPHK